jgi:hypothetical protein
VNITNITTFKKTRSMLNDAELSRKFGVETVKTAINLGKINCPQDCYKNHCREFMDRTKIRPEPPQNLWVQNLCACSKKVARKWG